MTTFDRIVEEVWEWAAAACNVARIILATALSSGAAAVVVVLVVAWWLA